MALPHEPLKGYLANVEAELSEAVRERESLRTQVERLRAALREIADGMVDIGGNRRVRFDSCDIARRALENK